MAHPDHALWKQGWRANQIPFHRTQVHPLLARFWSALKLTGAPRVFVPLCGKSLDLSWLHAQGHAIVGVELSPVAIKDFFKSAQRHPKRTGHGALTRWTQADLTLYCGDFFALTRDDLRDVNAAYDCAALTALPENLRAAYVAHLHAILPADCPVLLITVEDLDDDEQATDNLHASTEIIALYAGYFGVELLHAELHPAVFGQAGDQTDPRCIHKAYRLLRTTRPARPAVA